MSGTEHVVLMAASTNLQAQNWSQSRKGHWIVNNDACTIVRMEQQHRHKALFKHQHSSMGTATGTTDVQTMEILLRISRQDPSCALFGVWVDVEA
jgi:hypothetical protein